VPSNPLSDGNFSCYLGNALECIRAFQKENPKIPIRLYLVGGHTNTLRYSEAQALERWFSVHLQNDPIALLKPLQVSIGRDPWKWQASCISSRMNLEVLYTCLDRFRELHLFCEWSRRWSFRFLANRLFSGFELHAVPFDQRSLTISNEIKQRVWKLPIEILAWYIPAFYRYILYPRQLARILKIQKR
jgi:hypothetical protein